MSNEGYKNAVIWFLGHPGKLISGSKSCGPAMGIYNANVVIGDDVVWNGDVDLDVSRKDLIDLSESLSVEVKVYSESPVRIFVFDDEDGSKQHAARIQQIDDIRNNRGLVWTTATPELYRGENYSEARIRNQKLRDERIRDRQIYFGMLTPKGTEWRWHNTWFYLYIYPIYRYFLKDPFQIIRTWVPSRRFGWGYCFENLAKDLFWHFFQRK